MIASSLAVLASVAGWLVGKAAKFAGSAVVERFLGTFNKAADTKVRLAEIDSHDREVIVTQGTERQTAKMNWPAFWLVLVTALASPLTLWMSVTLYNIFWWQHGIWPQDWSIAAYPPSMQRWADMAMEWLFDPMTIPATFATATGVGLATGRR